MQLQSNIFLDIQFDKTRDELIFVDTELTKSFQRDPILNLYSFDECSDQLISKSSYKSVSKYPLSYHRRNMKQTSKGHNGQLNLQFNVIVNGQERKGFKDRELLDKYICENNLQFKSPINYSIMFLYIWQDDVYMYMFFQLQQIQGQTIQIKQQKTLVCPIEYEQFSEQQKKEFGVFDQQLELVESVKDMSDILLDVINSLGAVSGVNNNTQTQGLLFIVGPQMNNSQDNQFLNILKQSGYKPFCTTKYSKQTKMNKIKQITNIPQFDSTYLIDIETLSKSHQYMDIDIFKQQIIQVEQQNQIQIMLKKMDYLQVPLSFVLYEPDTSNLQSYIFRRYLLNDYMFFYDSSPIQKQKQKIEGGMYVQASVDLQQVILKNIAEGDYTALYASIILAKNISPETVSKVTSDSYKYQDAVQRELTIQIDTNKGIIPSIVEELLYIRKHSNTTIENQVVKLILSITFGIFGSEYYSLYNPNCGNAITAYGRVACRVAKECLEDKTLGICQQIIKGTNDSVIQQQTDSCIFQITDKCMQDKHYFDQQWKQLNININNHEDLKPTNNLFNFKFEYDKFAAYMIIPRAKNSKVSLIKKWDKNSGIISQQGVLTRIGDLYSQNYSQQKNNVILKYFTDLFDYADQKQGYQLSLYMDCTCFNSIQSRLLNIQNNCQSKLKLQQFIDNTPLNDKQKQILQQIVNSNSLSIPIDQYDELRDNSQCSSKFCYDYIYDEQLKRLQNLILDAFETNQLDQLVQEYSTFLKYSSEDVRCQYIEKAFNISQNCRFLYFGDKIIPAHMLTKHHLNQLRIHETINDLLRPIKSVISGEKSDQFSKYQLYSKGLEEEIRSYARINDIEANIELSDPNKSQCILRVESASEKRFIVQNLDEIEQLVLDNPLTSVHEVLYKKFNKMYFDIESKYPIDEYAMNYSIQFILKKLVEVNVNNIIHRACASSQTIKKPVNSFDINTIEHQKLIHNKQQDKYKKTGSVYQQDDNNDMLQQQFKVSFHINIDIKCTAQLNQFIAEQMNQKYMQLTGNAGKSVKDYGIFDVGVYKDKNQSMRLPLCIKIVNGNQVERRPLKILGSSKFRDFILTDTSKCLLEFDQIIHFDKTQPIDPARYCDKFSKLSDVMDDKQLIKIIAKKTNTNERTWKLKDKTIICTGAYECFVCKSTHSSDNLQVYTKQNQETQSIQVFVNCFSNKHRQQNKHLAVCIHSTNSNDIESSSIKKTSYQQLFLQINEQEPFSSIITQSLNQQYISFNLVKPTLYVISDMGTGKSQQIKRIISEIDKQQSVLCLSFRRTFSIEFAAKYGLVNYMDKPGRLNSKYHKRLIIQVDSLTRYDLEEYPQLLIIDEIESILERLYSCKDNYELIKKFIKLVKNSTNVIYMDGLIEKTTIDYLNIFRGVEYSEVDVIYNKFSPRCDYNYVVYPYNQNYRQHITDYFIDLVENQKKKVYGMVTSKEFGFHIHKQLLNRGISAIFYHGADDKQEDLIQQNGDKTSLSHIAVKKIHFKDVNSHWKNYQVVIHNSAITAGVSYDFQENQVDNFDIQVNVFSSDTTSPLSFFQGCHRVRYLKDKTVVTFVDNQYTKNSMCTPYQVFQEELKIESSINMAIDSDYDFSKQKQLQLWMRARYECAIAFKLNILFKYLKRMKYRVIIFNNPVTVKSKQVSKVDVPMSHQLDYLIRQSNPDIKDQQLPEIIANLKPLIAFNDNIQSKKINIDLDQYQVMSQLNISAKDQNLYDDTYKRKYDAINLDNQSYYILMKLNIKNTYHIDFQEINELNATQLKRLHDKVNDQYLRNGLVTLFSNNIDPKTSIDWMANITAHYRNIRNNNKQLNEDKIFEVDLVSTVKSIVHKYTQTPVQTKCSIIKDLTEILQCLGKCKHKTWIKIPKKIRKTKMIKDIQHLFSLFYIDVNVIDNKDLNIYELQINLIQKPIYQYILQI